MKHRIGYACINTSINATTNRTCRLKNCTDDKLRELISANLQGLKEIILWNISKNIYLYRISSSIIPFASHESNTIKWWEENSAILLEIGNLIKSNHMRVSMHPGQYVNINSNDYDVIDKSVKELDWHAKFLDTLGLDYTHRLILHVGGVYGDKNASMVRFVKQFGKLSTNLQSRLSIENDDKSYTIWDVLEVCERLNIPVVFDNLHHSINNTQRKVDDDVETILKLCFSTWNEITGIPKIHFSTQKQGERAGAHAESINIDDFIKFYFQFNKYDFDIMFETKDKEKSVLKAFRRLQLEAAKGVSSYL